MPPIKHALLGPSGAARWMACPPSAKWEASLPEPPEQDYTREGTLAHELSEAKLTDYLEGTKTHAAAWRQRNGADPLYNEAMDRYTDDYVEKVVAIYEGYQLADLDPHMYLEVRLDLAQWIPESFGTSDVVIVADGILHVIDLKYGKGVPVSAEGNPQARIYALGAYAAFRALVDFHHIRAEIIQPRLDADSVEELTMEALLVWAHDELVPKAQLAIRGEGEFNPTEKGCRFCKGRNLCRYNAAKQLELGRIDQTRGPELTKLEIAGILERVDGLTKWANGMKEWALEQALAGEKFPGYKLVEGRSVRRITDEDKAVARLIEAGYDTYQFTKLVGMTDLEHLVGKKKLGEVLEGLIEKPEGKPTLAKETDRRHEWSAPDKVSEYFND